MNTSKVWLVTGTSSGIGLVLVNELLAKGYRVVATVRQANDQTKQWSHDFGDQILIVTADVRFSDQLEAAVQQAYQQFGRIDVLVNNAGYGLIGAFEEYSEAQIRDQIETNFFGVVKLSQLVIPKMRENQDGVIFNVSSIAGRIGFRGVSLYAASKFALTALSESLSQELAPFNIRVINVEPGPYKTDWAGRSMVKTDEILESKQSPYSDLNKGIDLMFKQVDGNQPGDPLQIAQVMISAAEIAKPPVHLVLGDEAIKYWESYQKKNIDPKFVALLPYHQTAIATE
jgi:NAD(P)-dependent dehydrogenase (short-subunit alcohol dehydrogenase family)